MSFEDEFDGIIRKKAEAEEYPFDPAGWEKMETLLKAERGSGRGFRKLYRPLAGVAVLGVAAWLAFSYLTPGDDSSSETLALQPAVQEQETGAEPYAIEKIVLSPEEMVENQGTAREHHAGAIPGTEIQETAAPESRIAAPAEKQSRRLSAPESSVAENTIPKSIPAGERFVRDDMALSTDAEAAEDQEALTPNTGDTRQEVSQAEQMAASPAKESTREGQAEALLSPSTDASRPEVQLAGSVNTSPVAEETLETERLNRIQSLIPYEPKEAELIAQPFIPLERYDDDYYKAGRKRQWHYLAVEAGANYLMGWESGRGTDGKGLNGYLGLEYGLHLCDKLSLSLGLQGYNISNIRQPFYQISSKEYGFGSNTTYTEVTSHQLYYLAVPLKASYRINAANTIGLGINTAYLMTSGNTVSDYEMIGDEVKVFTSSGTQTWGVYEKTNRINFMLSAHYYAQFSRRMALGLELNYGFTDIFQNTENIRNLERPMGLRLGMRYTLFEK